MDTLNLVQYVANWEWDPPHTFMSHWQYPFGLTLLYLFTVVLLKWFMQSRAPFQLRELSLVYNAFLVFLSVTMLVSMILFASLRAMKYQSIFYGIFCSADDAKPMKGPFGFTIYVFYLSKFIETTDTFILILKKKPVIFLHIYHHVMMLHVPWTWLWGQWIAASWWCVVVNSLIHTFMYSYYLLSLLDKDIWWKRYLTKGQIVQFWSGFLIVCYWFWVREEYGCLGSWGVAMWSHCHNLLIIGLFFWFYHQSYSSPRARTSKKDANNKKVD